MKILFSLTYYTPYSSGLTLYVKRLGEALAKHGFQVSVLCFRHQKELRLQENINNVKVFRAKPLVKISKGFLSIDWLAKSYLEVKKADVVFINLPQFEGIILAILGKILRKKVISIYHCEVVLPPGILNKLINWLLNASNFISLWLSDTVITYTKDFADHSKVLPHFRQKLEFVYPPILVPKINKRVKKILMDKMDLEDQFVIGVAARLAAEKGIEYLLESIPEISSNLKAQSSKLQLKTQSYKNSLALKHLGGDRMGSPGGRESGRILKIVIAGPMESVGEKKNKDRIMRLVAKYKNYVVFLGELREKEMGSFYSLLDVLVLPSINSTEAFGMVQVEAMMMGVPVVATDLPGVRIPIQKTGMGKIVPIRNSQKLAEAIVDVLFNRNKYIKDKESIKKEFTFEKTVEFYQDLLATV